MEYFSLQSKICKRQVWIRQVLLHKFLSKGSNDQNSAANHILYIFLYKNMDTIYSVASVLLSHFKLHLYTCIDIIEFSVNKFWYCMTKVIFT